MILWLVGKLGEMTGMVLFTGLNPVVWISAFFFSQKPGHWNQAFKNGLVNLGCWLLLPAIFFIADEPSAR